MNCVDCYKLLSKKTYKRCQPCLGVFKRGTNKVKRNCINCALIFYRWNSELTNGRGKFCSRKCRGIYEYLNKKSFIQANKVIINNQMGSNNHQWKGGITPFQRAFRTSKKYKLWRKAVFEKDYYTCQICNQKGGELQADHIKPFSLFPDLRLDLNNGRTLCINCHRKTDTWGNRQDVRRVD